MNYRNILLIGSIFGLFAVVLGAFGAHGLEDRLTSTGRVETYNLAVEYQFYHSLALVAVGILMQRSPSTLLSGASIGFAAGILIFSGSLYILSVFDLPQAGAVTPFGGVAMITGWVLLVMHIAKKKASDM